MISLRLRRVYLIGPDVDPVDHARRRPNEVVVTGPPEVLGRIRDGALVDGGRGRVVLWAGGIPRMIVDRISFDQLWGPGERNRPQAIGTYIEGRRLPA